MARSRITLASYVTISRFFLVPVFIYLFLKDHFIAAVIVLTIAGLTDGLDGFLARRFNMRSRLGSMLDPAADKFLMLVSFIVLWWIKVIPWQITALVIGRDILIVLGIILLNLMKVKLYYKPTIVSKTATVSQIIVLVLSFLAVFLIKQDITLPLISKNLFFQIHQISLYLCAGLTLITFFQYGYIGYKFYRYGERKK